MHSVDIDRADPTQDVGLCVGLETGTLINYVISVCYASAWQTLPPPPN